MCDKSIVNSIQNLRNQDFTYFFYENMEDYFMAENLKVTLPGGYTLALENVDAAGVPDITQNAGENVLQAEADAQKPVTQEGAEYDAAAEADKGKEIENVQQVASQESSFYGLMVAQRALEGFGLKADRKGYESIEGFFKTPEAKAAMDTAKAWLAKKNGKLEIAKTTDIKESPASLKSKIMGINKESLQKGKSIGKFYQALGAVFYCWKIPSESAFTAALMLKKANGDITFKYFVVGAKLKNASNAELGLESVDALNAFLGLESDTPVEETPAETSDTTTVVDAPATEPAPAATEPDNDTAEVNVTEEITEEPAAPATEPAPEAPATEPAPAATEPAAPATEPAPEAPATEPAPAATEPAATEDDDAKAVESFYQDFFKGWNK